MAEINKLVVPIADGQGGYTPTEITFESGTGGHTIENESGTSMTARAGLQFKGVDVSDDSTNDRTIVDMSYTEITYSDWLQLTEQEQETGKWDVTDVPGADGTVSVELMTKLWENPDVTATFASQDITLSSDDYDLLMWVYCVSTTSSITNASFFVKGSGGTVLSLASAGSTSAQGAQNWRRFVSRTSDTVMLVGDGYVSYTGSQGVNNDRIIPYQIYGIKTRKTIEIKAIAPEVSTSASNCMMSDGETSVEEAINDVESDTLAITGFGRTFRLERVGRICFITYNGDVTSLTAGDLTFSQTLPERFRPTHLVAVHSDATSTSAKVILFFDSNGTITGYNYSGVISSRTSCRFGTLSYPALNV